ncbi:MAG: hypothetical protein J7K29_04375 [Candidatus Cloacimonetes bacterium]|nr:hypothetical protein [Candidatus Cloacimonadota bacterium]
MMKKIDPEKNSNNSADNTHKNRPTFLGRLILIGLEDSVVDNTMCHLFDTAIFPQIYFFSKQKKTD